MTNEYNRWPDKAGPSRLHFGRAVDRSIRLKHYGKDRCFNRKSQVTIIIHCTVLSFKKVRLTRYAVKSDNVKACVYTNWLLSK